MALLLAFISQKVLGTVYRVAYNIEGVRVLAKKAKDVLCTYSTTSSYWKWYWPFEPVGSEVSSAFKCHGRLCQNQVWSHSLA